MVDASLFISRLEKILEHYELSAAAFADTVGVQRSSISHLLKGRNKPSLEFVMKISERFPEVHLLWLLYGEGTFPQTDTGHTTKNPKLEEKKPSSASLGVKKVERIVIFYDDGTFGEYRQKL